MVFGVKWGERNGILDMDEVIELCGRVKQIFCDSFAGKFVRIL